jgi:hypothetical protein
MKELLAYAYILTETIRVIHVGLTVEIAACQGIATNFKKLLIKSY